MINSDNFFVKSINEASQELDGNRKGLQERIELTLIQTLSKATNLLKNDHQPMHVGGELERVFDAMNENLAHHIEWFRRKDK